MTHQTIALITAI